MKKKIRVAQVGMGHDHANVTFASMRKLTDDYEVVGLAEPVEMHMGRLESDGCFRGAKLYTVKELLDMDLDAVAIECDEEYATRYAQLFADRGVAVHMDKPGSPGAAAFEKLARALEKQHLPFQLGYMYRYNPVIQKAFAYVKEGKLGDILSVEAQMSVRHSVEKRNWLGKYPGGMLYYLGCHLIDLIYQLQGEPMHVIPLSQPAGFDGVTAEDQGMVLLQYPGGTSFAKSSAVEYNGFERRQLVISGTKGTIEIKPLEKYLDTDPSGTMRTYASFTNYENEKTPWRDCAEKWSCEPFDRYDAMMRDFAAMVRGEKENPYSYDYEIRLFRLIMRCCRGE